MTLQPADLDRLEQLAREATPGPWYVAWGTGSTFAVRTKDESVVPSARAISKTMSTRADAAYIADLDPTVVSELVAAARLGAAWQEAEAALPEGWVTGLIGIAVGTGRWYTASAYVDLTDYADDHEAESAQADSPAAALLSLAEALRGRSG